MTIQKYLDKNKISYNVTADGLIRIDGDISVERGGPKFEGVEEISGYVYVYEGATFDAPVLATVGGSVYVYEGATFDAPVLATVGGSVDVYEGATFDAPVLASIGEVRYNCEMFGHQIEVFDGIGCIATSTKEKDGVTIRACRKSKFKDGILVGEVFYVASQNGQNAHAETLKEAVDELTFKVGSRDVSRFKSMPLDTVKTVSEWALIYRMITGACQYGTKRFIENKGTMKETYTLKEILFETNGAYGHETFKSVVRARV